ncbi:MAG TPA: aminotransferase class I/II-fold pyridoxal phosphate-dependent enzyme [Solirubrobacteraceae bacterium]
MGFLDYYRQFEELPPDEVSRRLRDRRDAERSRRLAEVPALDLATSAWHEPPHPEVVNAATFALRRAVNAYPDPTAAALREAVAAAHGTEPERMVVSHGAGELLRAALRALLVRGGDVVLAWPGWARLPALVQAAGGTPRPADPGALRGALDERTRAVVLCRPADPTGAVARLEGVRALAAALPETAWLVLDEALAGFEPPAADGPLEHPRVLRVRSFSKAHAMAGFRIGYALLPEGADELAAALAPAGGVNAPALAGAQWAVESGAGAVARRRAVAARERERLAAALAGTPLAFPAGHGPFVWLSSAEHDGRALAEHLAARRIYVAPGAAWGDARHVRVTLRGAAATDRFVAALAEL